MFIFVHANKLIMMNNEQHLADIGQQVKTIREKNKINRYSLRMNGINSKHPSMIEDKKISYTINTLLKYLTKICPKGFSIKIIENE